MSTASSGSIHSYACHAQRWILILGVVSSCHWYFDLRGHSASLLNILYLTIDSLPYHWFCDDVTPGSAVVAGMSEYGVTI